jgi:hypothetical protein
MSNNCYLIRKLRFSCFVGEIFEHHCTTTKYWPNIACGMGLARTVSEFQNFCCSSIALLKRLDGVESHTKGMEWQYLPRPYVSCYISLGSITHSYFSTTLLKLCASIWQACLLPAIRTMTYIPCGNALPPSVSHWDPFPHWYISGFCPGSAEWWTEGAKPLTCAPERGVWGPSPRKMFNLNLLKCHFLAPESGNLRLFCIHKNILISV